MSASGVDAHVARKFSDSERTNPNRLNSNVFSLRIVRWAVGECLHREGVVIFFGFQRGVTSQFLHTYYTLRKYGSLIAY